VAEEKKKRRKKKRGHPLISGPQFATHVGGGGYYLGPGWLGYNTAQEDTQEAEAAAGGGEGGAL
jgi:hypothetical protein